LDAIQSVSRVSGGNISDAITNLARLSAIDIATQRCGKCKSRLMPLFAERQASQFQLYMKENMRKVMEDLPGASRADVMKEIGQRWAREKEAGKTIIEVSD
jgi:NAD(P)H-nitrite reductase large subunit